MTEWYSQFPTHNEMRFIGIYCPSFIQEIGTSLSGIQENETLPKHMNVDDLA